MEWFVELSFVPGLSFTYTRVFLRTKRAHNVYVKLAGVLTGVLGGSEVVFKSIVS